MALGTPVAAAAAYSAASGTTVSPAYPAGILTTDAVLLFVGQKPTAVGGGTVTTPTGWTLRDELTNAGGYAAQNADSGNTNLRVYSWNTPVAGQTGNLAVTIGGNDITWAFMVRVPTGGGTVSYGSADGQRTTTPTSPMSIALTNGATATNFQAGDVAIWAMCIPTDVTTPAQFSAQAITATGATFGTATELNEPDSNLGNDIGGYSAWAAVTAGSSTTAPTVTATLAGTLTNVRGPVVLLRLRESAAPQTLTQTTRFDNASTFFSATVLFDQTAAPATFANANQFYAAAVLKQVFPASVQVSFVEFDTAYVVAGQTLTPQRFDNTNTLYGPTASAFAELAPARYDNANTFFSLTVATTVELTPARYDNQQVFAQATVASSNQLTAPLYSNASVFYQATATPGEVALAPALYANQAAFFSPVVSAGDSVVAPALYTNQSVFYSAAVSAGAVTVTPARYDNTSAFFSPSVSAGEVVVSPALYANQAAFFSPSVTTGASTLLPGVYTNASTFYSATVVRGEVSLAPALATNVSQFFSPTVNSGAAQVTPDLYTNTSQFFGAAVATSNTISFDEYVAPDYGTPGYVSPIGFNSQQFFSPTVAPESVAIAPPLVANAQSFFAPTVSSGAATLLPARFDNAQTFYSPVVAPDAYAITAVQAKLLYDIYLLHGLASPLVVGPTSRTAGAVEQTVDETNGVVTITTTSDSQLAAVAPGLMIEELAALHGLTAPLVVSPTQRTAGVITQVFGTSGNATTVTRQ